MPSTTWPQTVYWPLRCGVGAKMMKNWLLALFGSEVRAMPSVPRSNGSVGELGRQVRLVGAAAAGAGRIAGLGHEARDHAMEDDAVVEALARQLLDPGDVLGREIGAQLDHDAAVVEVQ